MNKKKKKYAKMPLQSIEQMFGAIEINIPDTYKYNSDTVVLVLDAVKEECKEFSLSSKEIKTINKLDSIERGTYLYTCYKGV